MIAATSNLCVASGFAHNYTYNTSSLYLKDGLNDVFLGKSTKIPAEYRVKETKESMTPQVHYEEAEMTDIIKFVCLYSLGAILLLTTNVATVRVIMWGRPVIMVAKDRQRVLPMLRVEIYNNREHAGGRKNLEESEN